MANYSKRKCIESWNSLSIVKKFKYNDDFVIPTSDVGLRSIVANGVSLLKTLVTELNKQIKACYGFEFAKPKESKFVHSGAVGCKGDGQLYTISFTEEISLADHYFYYMRPAIIFNREREYGNQLIARYKLNQDSKELTPAEENEFLDRTIYIINVKYLMERNDRLAKLVKSIFEPHILEPQMTEDGDLVVRKFQKEMKKIFSLPNCSRYFVVHQVSIVAREQKILSTLKFLYEMMCQEQLIII